MIAHNILRTSAAQESVILNWELVYVLHRYHNRIHSILHVNVSQDLLLNQALMSVTKIAVQLTNALPEYALLDNVSVLEDLRMIHSKGNVYALLDRCGISALTNVLYLLNVFMTLGKKQENTMHVF